jgi:integrase
VPRSRKADQGKLAVLCQTFSDPWLDEIASSDVERALDAIGATRAAATRNRYRSYLSAMFKRARRDGHVTGNPVREVPQLKENNARLAYLTCEAEEVAIREALPDGYRPHFLVSVHTGLRWSEQMGLTWRHVDFLTGFLTIPRSKHGGTRRVPMNTVVRSALVDLATRRIRPDDPEEPVFTLRPKQSVLFFPRPSSGPRPPSRSRGVTRRAWTAMYGTPTGTRSPRASSWPGWICGRCKSWADGRRRAWSAGMRTSRPGTSRPPSSAWSHQAQPVSD